MYIQLETILGSKIITKLDCSDKILFINIISEKFSNIAASLRMKILLQFHVQLLCDNVSAYNIFSSDKIDRGNLAYIFHVNVHLCDQSN